MTLEQQMIDDDRIKLPASLKEIMQSWTIQSGKSQQKLTRNKRFVYSFNYRVSRRKNYTQLRE